MVLSIHHRPLNIDNIDGVVPIYNNSSRDRNNGTWHTVNVDFFVVCCPLSREFLPGVPFLMHGDPTCANLVSGSSPFHPWEIWPELLYPYHCSTDNDHWDGSNANIDDNRIGVPIEV